MGSLDFSKFSGWKSSIDGDYSKVSDSSGTIWNKNLYNYHDCAVWNPSYRFVNKASASFNNIIPLLITGSDCNWVYDASSKKSIKFYKIDCDISSSPSEVILGGCILINDGVTTNPQSFINIRQSSNKYQYYKVDSQKISDDDSFSYTPGSTVPTSILRSKENGTTVMYVGVDEIYSVGKNFSTDMSSHVTSCGSIIFNYYISCGSIEITFKCVDGSEYNTELIPITDGTNYGFRCSVNTIDEINAGTATIFCKI